MTLKWIGTRTQDDRTFNPAGVGSPATGRPLGMELLPRGSLLLEVTVRPSSHPVNLIRYRGIDPWPSGLTVCLEPDGTVRLILRQGARQMTSALKTRLGASVQTVHITYIWDAPARKGVLSAHIPDLGVLWQTEVLSPFPLSLRDAQRMMMDTTACSTDGGLGFAAIADTPCPLGPMPGLSGSAAVDTPRGPIALRDIKVGDYVKVKDSKPAEVLWVGSATVPALGRFAPMRLRRPYMGLWDDLVAARDQRACLSGSEVEYLFGEERVATAIRHLEVRKCAEPVRPNPAVVTYHQILLENHAIITVNGATVESFDASAALVSERVRKTSVLADMPVHRCPNRIGLAAPVLQGYEALTLTGATIG